jgi:hypothetical protein
MADPIFPGARIPFVPTGGYRVEIPAPLPPRRGEQDWQCLIIPAVGPRARRRQPRAAYWAACRLRRTVRA